MMKALFVALALIATSLAASISITGTIRDFTPSHPDFEHYLGTEPGLVQSLLDIDGKPVLSAGSHATVTSSNSFAQWYRDVAGVNIPISYTITLEDIGNGVYSFSSNSFFPIDGQGYGNYGNTGRNFHFTSEWRNTFTYVGGETFTFTGDDDVFVFANGYLILDLGGVHGSETKTVNLDLVAASAGMTVGNDYVLSVFQAERHTVQSNFRIDTTIQLISEEPEYPTNPGRDAYICEVNFPNFCPGEPQDVPSRLEECPEDPTIEIGGVTYALDNFNSISFGDFYAPSGDVEGRSLIAGNLNLPQGQYSFGYLLQTAGVTALDNSLPASLVVGGNANFQGGSVHPDGSGIPYSGDKEDMYIGGSFSGPSYLQGRVLKGSPNALSADLANAQDYYVRLSESWAATTDNAVFSIQYGEITLTCPGLSTTSIQVHVPATQFNTITSYKLVDCNEGAQIVFTITGTEDVKFAGNNIYHREERVLYNIPGARVVRIETEVRGSILAPLATYNQPGMGVVKGLVIVANMAQVHQINRVKCVRPAPPPHPTEEVCPAFETQCAGLDFPLANGVYSFRDFNVITFKDFVADTGDIEGRLAAKRDVTVGKGWSVGYELSTLNNQPDNSLPYSLVAGRHVNWGSGSIHPDGSGVPYPGKQENMFVGGTYTGFGPLQERVVGPCSSTACLDAYFNAAHDCYTGYQTTLAAKADNVAKNIYWSGLFLTCSDANADSYTVSLTPAEMDKYTYTVLDNCNLQASWTLNIRGTDDVRISGGSFPGIPGGVVYNILGSRTITITETNINGHVLAPDSTINQPGGVINGKVVAGDITMSRQINRENNCPEDTTVEITVPTNEPTYIGSNSFSVQSPSFIRTGDSITVGEQTYTVTEATANKISFSPAASANYAAGSMVKASISGNRGRAQLDTPADSSASTASVLVAVLIAIFAMLF